MKDFTPEQFTPTKFTPAKAKAKYANDLASFILGGFKWSDFKDSLYKQLSNSFGHIAHYDRRGFYDTWFSNENQIREWFAYMQAATPVGSPEYTNSDVERAFQSWFSENLGKIQQIVMAYGEEESAVAEQAGSEVEFVIAAISKSTGDFGHKEHIIVGRNGYGFKGYRQPKAHGSNRDLIEGEIFKWTVNADGKPTESIFETCSPIPSRAPQAVIDEAFAAA